MNKNSNKNDDLFSIIWQNYNKRIYYFMSQIINRNYSDLDDIFQEIMIKIYENSGTYNYEYSIDTWLYTITRNHCIDYIRKKKIDTIDLDQNFHSKDYCNPEQMTLSTELHDSINSMLEKFDPADRQITYLVKPEKHVKRLYIFCI